MQASGIKCAGTAGGLQKNAAYAGIFFNNLQGVTEEAAAPRVLSFLLAPLPFHGLLKRQHGNKLSYRLLFKTLGVSHLDIHGLI